MIDTLKICASMKELGEMLSESCPENDCQIYQETYEQYKEATADYTRIIAAFPDLSLVTIRAIEQNIRSLVIDLGKLWRENYSVVKYREAAGMIGRKEA